MTSCLLWQHARAAEMSRYNVAFARVGIFEIGYPSHLLKVGDDCFVVHSMEVTAR